jgi:hypothetical protein
MGESLLSQSGWSYVLMLSLTAALMALFEIALGSAAYPSIK